MLCGSNIRKLERFEIFDFFRLRAFGALLLELWATTDIVFFFPHPSLFSPSPVFLTVCHRRPRRPFSPSPPKLYLVAALAAARALSLFFFLGSRAAAQRIGWQVGVLYGTLRSLARLGTGRHLPPGTRQSALRALPRPAPLSSVPSSSFWDTNRTIPSRFPLPRRPPPCGPERQLPTLLFLLAFSSLPFLARPPESTRRVTTLRELPAAPRRSTIFVYTHACVRIPRARAFPLPLRVPL